MVVGNGKLNVGDRVVLVPGIACGACKTCLSYGAHEHLCDHRRVHGFGHPDEEGNWPIGGFSTLIELIDGLWVQKVPEKMPYERAVLGELVAVSVRAVERGVGSGRPEIGLGTLVAGKAAVLGLGPLGSCVALVLQYLGFEVTGFERCKWRAEYVAKELSIETVQVSGEAEDIVKNAKMKNECGIYDLVFECAGEPEAFAAAIEIVRKGGRLIEVGHFFSNGSALIDPAIICRKDLDIVGSVLAPPLSYIKAMRVLSDPMLPFDRMITNQFPLKEIAQILALQEQGQFLKVIVLP
jgi:L-iditol 2-dehydrogenase